MGPAVKPRRDAAPDSDNPKHAQVCSLFTFTYDSILTNTDHSQMIKLREELDMCAMKIAQLQARLIATLDELDAQRDAHLREIHAERNAKENLSRKLDSYLDEVTRAERERDDMRELVSILVEKGACLYLLADSGGWPRIITFSALMPLPPAGPQWKTATICRFGRARG